MFHFSKFNGGRYLEIGPIFHKSVEIGYQFPDSTGYDLNFSITSQDHGSISFSLCLGRFFFEINLFDRRQFNFDFDIALEEQDAACPPALPEITVSSLVDRQETQDEIEETYPIPDMAYSAEAPEYFGPITPRVDLPVQPRQGPSFAEQEFNEHGSIALRHWVGMEEGSDNTIGSDRQLVKDATILLRAQKGGFYFLRLQYKDGWYVSVGAKDQERHVSVVFDTNRGLWVIKELV